MRPTLTDRLTPPVQQVRAVASCELQDVCSALTCVYLHHCHLQLVEEIFNNREDRNVLEDRALMLLLSKIPEPQVRRSLL